MNSQQPLSPKPLSTMRLPAPANERAIASPIPEVDPVTIAVLPFKKRATEADIVAANRRRCCCCKGSSENEPENESRKKKKKKKDK